MLFAAVSTWTTEAFYLHYECGVFMSENEAVLDIQDDILETIRNVSGFLMMHGKSARYTEDDPMVPEDFLADFVKGLAGRCFSSPKGCAL